MKYSKIFSIKSETDVQSLNQLNSKFFLKDYKQYEPKLESNFYYNYFLHKLLFELKITEVNEFLIVQFENSGNKNNFLEILDLEVLPSINNIRKNANANSTYGNPSGDVKINDDFILRNNEIISTKYQFSKFYHIAKNKKLGSRLIKIHELVSNFYSDLTNQQHKKNFQPIKWITGPAKLGFIISQLIEQKYISPPLKQNGEINTLELAVSLSKTFDIEKGGSTETLRRYLNVSDKKNQGTKKKFDKEGFCLPDAEII